MRAVIQRVLEASVTVDGVERARIRQGLLVLLAVEDSDTDDDINWLSGKIVRLRIFDDDTGEMNLSVLETKGEVLVVSQFTLYASTRKGNRPSYVRAAKPGFAEAMYERFISNLAQCLGKPVQTGHFGADMLVCLSNDGPVTIIIDSKLRE